MPSLIASLRCCSFIVSLVSLILNILLIFIIIKCRSSLLGTYSRFLFSFAIIDIIFSSIHLMIVPGIFVSEGSFALVGVGPLSSSQTIIVRLLPLCVFPAASIAFIIHIALSFAYRYVYLCRPELHWLLKSCPLTVAICAVELFLSAELAALTILFMWPSKAFEQANNEALRARYNMTFSEIAYLGTNLYSGREVGKGINWSALAVMINVTILLATAFVVIEFCSKKMREITSEAGIVSERTRKQHALLLKCLSLQTIALLAFLYIPIFVSLLFTISGANLGVSIDLLSGLLAFAPAINPLMIIYFVRDYRKVVEDLLVCKPKRENEEMVSSRKPLTVKMTSQQDTGTPT